MFRKCFGIYVLFIFIMQSINKEKYNKIIKLKNNMAIDLKSKNNSLNYLKASLKIIFKLSL